MKQQQQQQQQQQRVPQQPGMSESTSHHSIHSHQSQHSHTSNQPINASNHSTMSPVDQSDGSRGDEVNLMNFSSQQNVPLQTQKHIANIQHAQQQYYNPRVREHTPQVCHKLRNTSLTFNTHNSNIITLECEDMHHRYVTNSETHR